MEDDHRKAIRQALLSEIDNTNELVAKYSDLTRPIAPENAIGRVSRMDAINNKSINDAALSKARQKLKALEVALENVDDSDFGLCLKCQKPIPTQRILLMPHVRLCVNCAS